jgi:diguanylate cyclase (GGDEF)-like protein
VELSKRTGQPVSVLFFDLDGFKQINDMFGHEEGDHALGDFSRCLQEAFRESDVVARLGGDEFCVLVATAPKGALQGPLARLAEEVAARNAECEPARAIRYSVGMASFDPSQHDCFEDLLRDADEAMYSDKGHGRGQAA